MTQDRAKEILAHAQRGESQFVSPSEIAEAFEALALVERLRAMFPRFERVLFGVEP